MAQWQSAALEVPKFKSLCKQKENLSQVQSEQYCHQYLYTRVKCLKLLKMKTRSHFGTVVECRTRDPEVPFESWLQAERNLSQV